MTLSQIVTESHFHSQKMSSIALMQCCVNCDPITGLSWLETLANLNDLSLVKLRNIFMDGKVSVIRYVIL